MLQVVSINGLTGTGRTELVSLLNEELSRQEQPRLESSRSGLPYWHWPRQRVVLVAEHAPLRSLNAACLGLVTELLEEGGYAGYQVLLNEDLSESTYRQLRGIEEQTLNFQYHCFLLHATEVARQRRGAGPAEEVELNRLLKTSQNKPINATWLSTGTQEELICLAMLINGRMYDPIYATALDKLSSGYTAKVETPLSQIRRRHYSDLKQREIYWRPKTYTHKLMDEEKWGVARLPAEAPRVKRLVLYTGTGRSGTTWFGEAMKLIGLDVRHQANGEHGCSGAEFAIDADWYPWFPVYGGGDCANVGERRSDYDYAHVFHGVRHPLWAIPSLQKNYAAINAEFWVDAGVLGSHVMDATGVVRNAEMYYYINRAIDESKQAEYRFQIERVEQEWPRLMEMLGLEGTPWPNLGRVNKAVGWGQYEPLTWTGLEDAVGKSLADAIHDQAKGYGYE